MKPSKGNSNQVTLEGRPKVAGTSVRKPKPLRTAGAEETLTICPYCSVGCGMVVHTVNGKIVNIEGDSEHPVSEGALCSKGAAALQLVNNPWRVTKPLYRPPNSTDWKEVEWDWALDRIARRVKETRDRTFKLSYRTKVAGKGPGGEETEAEKDLVINMTDGMVSIGSCSINNEECYLLQRLMRSWGIVYFDDKTRT